MNHSEIDEKILIENGIEAIGLSDRERSRALASFAKADALVSAFFWVWKLLHRTPKQAAARVRLKSQS